MFAAVITSAVLWWGASPATPATHAPAGCWVRMVFREAGDDVRVVSHYKTRCIGPAHTRAGLR